MSLSVPSKPQENTFHFFEGGGEMGALMRAYDWDGHPLGNPGHWPQSLQANIRLLLHSNFPMFIWWSKDLYAFHNDAYLPALGHKHPQALGQPARQIWPEIWKDVGSVAENILSGGDSFYAEALLLYLERKGFAEETYWTFSYSPAFNDEGQVEGVFCACFEVTSTVLGQRRLKTLKDISDGLSQIHTLEESCQWACETISENPQDLPFSQIYLLDQQQTQATLFGACGAGAPAFPAVVNVQQDEGSLTWPWGQVYQTRQAVEFPLPPDGPARQAVVLPLLWPGQDQLLGFLVSGISPVLDYDLDYRNFHGLVASQVATSIASVKTRLETTRQQADLIDMFEQAPVAISIMRGENFVVELANPGICKLWRKQHKDVIGKPILEALPEIKGQGIIELLQNVFTTGVPYVNNELPVALENHGQLETVYFSFVYHPLRSATGVITGVIAVAIEINEQVEARHEIEAINRELMAVNADLDNFVYSASHDLKAPISNIEGLMSTLVEFLPPQTLEQDVVQRVLSLMKSSVDRFKRSVADLTDVAKIQREDSEDVSFLDLRQVVEDVRLDFENAITETGAQVELDFAPHSQVRFSAKNVRSIVYNLFSNALKYRSPQRPPHIRIKTQVTSEYVVLTVADNGLGINATDLDKIFSMFKRLHDHVEGTGIGLYIVKRIVENANGKIEVESTLGQGTTFHVYLRR